MFKQCAKCKEIKALEQFGKDTNTKSGIRSRCKPCRVVDSKEWQILHPGNVAKSYAKCRKNNPVKVKNGVLEREYGISIDIFNAMLISQNNVCAICKLPETIIHNYTKQVRSLAVDHCHTTGKVRGLLCTGCNAALGFIKENPQTATFMTKYIKFHRNN